MKLYKKLEKDFSVKSNKKITHYKDKIIECTTRGTKDFKRGTRGHFCVLGFYKVLI